MGKIYGRHWQLPLTCGRIVKKANELARARNKGTTSTVNKLVAAFISQINVKDNTFKQQYTLPKVSTFNLEGSENYKWMEKVRTALAKLVVEINTTDEYGNKVFIGYPMFKSVIVDKDNISVQFNEKLSKFLLKLKEKYTQYDLSEFLILMSKYSQQMFEILNSWKGLDNYTISLNELIEIINPPPSLRKYKDFKRYVLTRADEEINTVTSLKYKWEEIKEGRTVTAIKFTFIKPKPLSNEQEKQIKEFEKERVKAKRHEDQRNRHNQRALSNIMAYALEGKKISD